MYVILLFALRFPLKRDKIHMVSQMAHAKKLRELFMAHQENLYNILCYHNVIKVTLDTDAEVRIIRASTAHKMNAPIKRST